MNTQKEYIINAENISFTYKKADKPSLNNISFNIKKGEIYGLIGPNGAGKTTLISIIATLLKPQGGAFEICGVDLKKRPSEVRKKIGLIPQNLALYQNLTGRENLYYFGRLYGMGRKQLNDVIAENLDIFGLKEKADSKVFTYSGGMKRRINLLAGILHKPSLLLLDEPTVGIDAQSRNMIVDNLNTLNRQGVSMIYTSHYMEEIQKLCSRVSIIDHGKIIETDSPQTLVDEDPHSSDLSDLFLNLTGKKLRN